MSGIIGSKLNVRGSGHVAKLGTDGQVLTSSGPGVQANYEDAGGGLDWQTIVTASTMTAVAGNGYWIDTSSNACVITLPSSASNGDEIMFADYARNWGTNGIEFDSNGLNYQGDDDDSTVEYGTDGHVVHIVYSGATNGWIPILDKTVDDVPVAGNSNGILGPGYSGGDVAVTNLISNVGVVAADTAGVATARRGAGATQYGGDKGIFGFGYSGPGNYNLTNLVSNSGVVSSDVTGIGTARAQLAGGSCSYGGDKGIFCYGNASVTNLISNVGVVASDTAAVGTVRHNSAGCEYGGDKGIWAYGTPNTNLSNLISNVGVVSSDVTGVGTARNNLAGCSFGEDKGIIGFGSSPNTAITNLISNVGVVASDTAGASGATARTQLAACEFGGDKGIFAMGTYADSNIVSNTGVVAADVTAPGTLKSEFSACSYN